MARASPAAHPFTGLPLDSIFRELPDSCHASSPAVVAAEGYFRESLPNRQGQSRAPVLPVFRAAYSFARRGISVRCLVIYKRSQSAIYLLQSEVQTQDSQNQRLVHLLAVALLDKQKRDRKFAVMYDQDASWDWAQKPAAAAAAD
jgi:hypothetical protein